MRGNPCELDEYKGVHSCKDCGMDVKPRAKFFEGLEMAPAKYDWDLSKQGNEQTYWCVNRGREDHTLQDYPRAGACAAGPDSRGLCDLAGNGRGWVWDVFDNYPVPATPRTPDPNAARVTRGGSFNEPAGRAWRTARRGKHPHDARKGLGFRLVRGAQDP